MQGYSWYSQKSLEKIKKKQVFIFLFLFAACSLIMTGCGVVFVVFGIAGTVGRWGIPVGVSMAICGLFFVAVFIFSIYVQKHGYSMVVSQLEFLHESTTVEELNRLLGTEAQEGLPVLEDGVVTTNFEWIVRDKGGTTKVTVKYQDNKIIERSKEKIT